MNMSELMNLREQGYTLRQAAQVKRCHIVTTIGHQTTGEHSYHVALLCWEMYDGQPSAELLKAALFHDLAEVDTGDMPANVKWANPQLKNMLEQLEEDFNVKYGLVTELEDEERLVLKYADSMELAFFCIDQIRMGNWHVKIMLSNILNALTTLPKCHRADGVLARLIREINELR